MKYIILFLSTIVFLVSCDLPWQPGPQPNYIEKNTYQNQFNILGILRPGNVSGMPHSFVHLETTYDYFDVPDSTKIGDAIVRLFNYTDTSQIDTIEMTFTNFSGIFDTKEYRTMEIDSVDSILAGKTFSISCEKHGYPELTSETTIPEVPVIVNDSIIIQTGKIEFDILRDERVQVYDIYLNYNNQEIAKRVLMPDHGNTKVEIDFSFVNPGVGKLTIYAYDLKLSEYITYNVIIKPQTYQDRYSTVKNGFGCFGSLNILVKNIMF